VARDLDVVVVCEINVDIVVSGLAGPPDFGAERLVEGVTLTAGSSGVLTATGLADLGLKVGVCGLLGDDVFAHFMMEHLARHGIDSSGVVVDPAERTGATVALSAGSDRALLTFPGAMTHLRYEHLRFETIARGRHLHLSSFFLQTGLRPRVAGLLARARTLGLSVSADTGHDPADDWSVDGLLDGIDLFLPNEVEALGITGATTVDDALARLAATVPTVAVKCGAEGAWAAHGLDRIFEPPLTIEAVDTTGAGDAFDAGFLSAWLDGADLERCLQRGNACGALTAAHIGGSGAIDLERVAALLRRHGR
jgi:sugar/nucleoside kinase (ribokinase family)